MIISHCYFHLHLIIFPEPPPGPFPEPRRRDGVGAVNVAPVNEGGDRVKLLPDAGTAAATEMRIFIFICFKIFLTSFLPGIRSCEGVTRPTILFVEFVLRNVNIETPLEGIGCILLLSNHTRVAAVQLFLI